jgi:DEAD/DEAH box helicase domain-containing protein
MATTLALGNLLEAEEVVYRTLIPSRDAREDVLPESLDPAVVSALLGRGLTGLYSHQAEAFAAAERGEHVMVSTGTASGKTLAFNLPVLNALAAEPKLRALYLYPTKALAQDQARTLAAFRLPRLRAAIYDGDTEAERRWQIRKSANVILTNPDMLHVGVLPHHDRWGDVLQNLRYVVIDEAHVYRGVFGSHVANVLRRLRRSAAIYGAEPQFLLASATIANPGEQARALLGLDVTVVDDDGAPRAEQTAAFWNPPLLDEELGIRASALGDASRILAGLVSHGLRTICFAKSRKAAELVHRFTCDRVPELAGRLSPYRAGYTPAQRREIERRLVEGELLGVTATDALELGIDIGLLDCAICVGFPGTVASLRQQWGRAGRRGHGLAVLVASEDALDQFFMREPELLMNRRVEAAILDHANHRILDGHVRAAAFEAPLDARDAVTLGPAALERAAALAEAGELRETKAGYVWPGRDYPAARVSLRSTGPDAIAIVDAESGTVLGLVERERAYSTVHEGAVYLHLGESYEVLELDLDARTALVRPFRGDYYTQAKKETNLTIEHVHEAERRLGLEVFFGDVAVTEQVVAYRKRSLRDGENLELVALELPETTFETEAVWLLPEPAQLEGLERMPTLLGTLHAAEHSLIALLPLWAMCDRWDIGGLSTNVHFQTGRPTIFVYDGHSGGVGITERGYRQLEGWVADTARLLAGCPCKDGCPSCVQSPKCGNLNEFLDKDGALTLLQRLLAQGRTSPGEANLGPPGREPFPPM